MYATKSHPAERLQIMDAFCKLPADSELVRWHTIGVESDRIAFFARDAEGNISPDDWAGYIAEYREIERPSLLREVRDDAQRRENRSL